MALPKEITTGLREEKQAQFDINSLPVVDNEVISTRKRRKSRRNTMSEGQVSFNFERGGLNIPDIQGSLAIYGIMGELVVPDIPGSRVDSETGEIIPLKEEKIYPLPVDAKWVNQIKKYQLGGVNYSLFRERLMILQENKYFLKIKNEGWLDLSDQELLSKFVVIQSGTYLRNFFEKSDDSVQLFGNIIALPEKRGDKDWQEKSEQWFIYIARVVKEIHKNKRGKSYLYPPQYKYDGKSRSIETGRIFQIGAEQAYLLSGQLSSKSGLINY
jgi:hypothetical protein